MQSQIEAKEHPNKSHLVINKSPNQKKKKQRKTIADVYTSIISHHFMNTTSTAMRDPEVKGLERERNAVETIETIHPVT